ncbi:Starvation-inducible outer membrane lipoprotein [Thiorhodovibrio winogradskyi]|uniref:Starvation-inducible outer membrane lipoprotein n=2 Tax=Thiorhodovibrio winogradskyi TaxID=77007 RepID=A0ABZ0S558_9GAMM
MQGLPPETLPLGEHFTWAGILIETRHLAKATELDISARPLDTFCRIQGNAPALGRFRVRYPGYVETAHLLPGQPLRVSGRLASVETRADAGERIPLITQANLDLLSLADQVRHRPRIGISIGAGSGWSGGGIGISF